MKTEKTLALPLSLIKEILDYIEQSEVTIEREFGFYVENAEELNQKEQYE